MDYLPLVLSILPFLVFIFLLFRKKTTLLLASSITLGLYTILAIFYWQILGSALYISYVKGALLAFDIFIIIFGAIFFLELLKDLKIIKNISYYLSSLSADYRVQVILIAWFFEAFLEGTSGFGIPAAVAIPLLVGIGLSPFRALVVGLLGNSVASIFGAAGTPIKVGLATLSVANVPIFASIFNFVGVLIPVFMVWVITSGRPNRKKEFLEAVPFALLSGFLFLIPSYFGAKFLGQEFPTIIGSIVGLILVTISVKLKFLIPKNNVSLQKEDITQAKKENKFSALKSFMPYLILVGFLILAKVLIGHISIPLNLGFKTSFSLFNPGFIFIIVAILISIIWKSRIRRLVNFSKTAFKGAIFPFLSIAAILAVVQIMINSGQNSSGLASVISLISDSFQSKLLPVFAPIAGAFGAFLTGSTTTSSVMFGTLLNSASLGIGFNTDIILSLLVVGAGLGSMMGLADILTAEAIVGVKNQETKVVKAVILPCLLCLMIIALIGLKIFQVI